MLAGLDAYRECLRAGRLDRTLREMYGTNRVETARDRGGSLLDRAERAGCNSPVIMFSAPGRTELGGNHTDHNHGHVLAAGVHLDCLAVVAPLDGRVVTIHSEGFDKPIVVDLSDTSPRSAEEGTSEALVRGVADGFRNADYAVQGFEAWVSCTIPMGAGLSSSAAFEVLIGRVFNHLFNDGDVPTLDIARFAKRAENLHFGKPCGFMDQMASAFEGVISIDFENPDMPGVERVEGDFASSGYRLAVVNTGGSHADLTPDYAAIPEEMSAAATLLGRSFARGLGMVEVAANVKRLRENAGDRAVLRLMHFIEENERAVVQGRALAQADMDAFLRLVKASGDSSLRLLQNCFSPSRPTEQRIPLALSLSEYLLGEDGAWRVHGGGFAGTIQVYVPEVRFEAYRTFMDEVFGKGAVVPLEIRQPGHEYLAVEV